MYIHRTFQIDLDLSIKLHGILSGTKRCHVCPFIIFIVIYIIRNCREPKNKYRLAINIFTLLIEKKKTFHYQCYLYCLLYISWFYVKSFLLWFQTANMYLFILFHDLRCCRYSGREKKCSRKRENKYETTFFEKSLLLSWN